MPMQFKKKKNSLFGHNTHFFLEIATLPMIRNFKDLHLQCPSTFLAMLITALQLNISTFLVRPDQR